MRDYTPAAVADICGIDRDSVYLVALPAAHNFPMSSPGFFGALYAGARVVLSPGPGPDVAFPLIAAERASTPREEALAVTMAREALTRLANAEQDVGEGSDEAVPVASVVSGIERAAAELARLIRLDLMQAMSNP